MPIPVALWSPGLPELLVILLLVLMLFGAGKLPAVFRTMGEGIRSFREGQEGVPPKDVGSDAPRAIDGERVHDAEELRTPVR